MRKNIRIFVSLLVLTLELQAQGVTRAQGLGVRLSNWNITGRRTSLYLDGAGRTQVDVGGMGPAVYYFSRALRNLYLEASLGVISGVTGDAEAGRGAVSVESIVPLVLGLRYDVMSDRLSGALHPYLAVGGGPYSVFNIKTQQFEEGATHTESTIQTRMDYGWFFGGGVNLTLTNWFALNADLKYHLIEIPELKDYSGLELGIGFSIMWGRQLELYEIRRVQVVVSEIYPVYHQFYQTFPIALVTVKNRAGRPVEVNISAGIKGYSPRNKDSGYVRIGAGQSKEIPVTVYFNRRLLDNKKRESVILDMNLEVRAAAARRESINVPIVIHSRDAWNGDMAMLPLFLTPEDAEVRAFVRKAAAELPPVEAGLEIMQRAEAVFEALARERVRYLPDPNIPFYRDDRVQFAAETLSLRTGDCDDLAVLYAALLESLGIETAFVEVQDPQKTLAHVYLMFNTGVTAAEAFLISENEKRYVLRESPTGRTMVWAPIEATLIAEGFQQAWSAAALAYLQDGVVRGGLNEGWVKIIDHHS